MRRLKPNTLMTVLMISMTPLSGKNLVPMSGGTPSPNIKNSRLSGMDSMVRTQIATKRLSTGLAKALNSRQMNFAELITLTTFATLTLLSVTGQVRMKMASQKKDLAWKTSKMLNFGL